MIGKECGSKRKGLWLQTKPLSIIGMKKRIQKVLVALFIIIIASSTLNCLTLGSSLSMRSPKDDSKPLDYEICLNTRMDSLLSLDVEFERQDGKEYRNIELFTWYYWKLLQVSGKYINIEEDELENISVDTRLRWKSYSAGIAEVWDISPKTMLVFGKDIRYNFRFIGIVNTEFRLMTNFYTNNFVIFNNETEALFKTKLLTWVWATMRYKSRYYDSYKFSVKLGIELEI